MPLNSPVPGYNNRVSYINGLSLNFLTVGSIAITPGACSDSTNTNDIIVNNTLTVFTTYAGANGLDAGTVANNTFYKIFLIGSSRGLKPTAAVLSSGNLPAMPDGYDMYRRIGYVLTNGSAQLVVFYALGSSVRRINYDAPITVLNATGNTTYTTLNLGTLLALPPGVQAVKLNYRYVPVSAGNFFLLRPALSASTSNIIVAAPVASQPIGGCLEMNTDSNQSIAYKTTLSASDALSLYVYGYDDFL